MEISFNEFGTVLATRALGARIRADILESLKNDNLVTFDLQGVTILSNSFADECFAKLLFDIEFDVLKAKTTFKNTTADIQHIISYAFKDRLKSFHLA